VQLVRSAELTSSAVTDVGCWFQKGLLFLSLFRGRFHLSVQWKVFKCGGAAVVLVALYEGMLFIPGLPILIESHPLA
jgi:hypothetical protein